MQGNKPILTFGEYELDSERRELRRSGEPVELQPTPLRLLLYLAEHRDRAVPTRELLDTLWPETVVADTSIAKALNQARRAVRDDGTAQRVIRTQRRLGYRFVAEVEERRRSRAAELSTDGRPFVGRGANGRIST